MGKKKEKKARKRLNDALIKKLYKKTKSIAAVAHKVGASYGGIFWNLDRQGVTIVKLKTRKKRKK